MKKHSEYKRKILKELFLRSSQSCLDLSLAIGKSVPFTTILLNELLHENLIVEQGLASSTGGRRPIVYTLGNDMMYIVAVSMDQMATEIALIDMHNKIVGEKTVISLPLTNNPHALDIVIKGIAQFIEEKGIALDRIIGVGIGMPGFIDSKRGINYSFLRTENDISLSDYIESFIGVPVLIDNDSRLIALAELMLRYRNKKINLMVINIGWGVGLGIVIKGEIFRGMNGFAGEFSHIPLFDNNKMCQCGKSGCLETETSILMIVEKAIKGIQLGKVTSLTGLSMDRLNESALAIIQAAKNGDKFAVGLFSEAGYNVGRGVAILLHLLNPEVVILSGMGALADQLWLAPIQYSLNEHCIPRLSHQTEIKISELGLNAPLFGAAALIMEHYDSIKLSKQKLIKETILS